MSVLYRDHRGTLVESMKTVHCVESLAELREHLTSRNEWLKPDGELKVFKYGVGIDDRINWDTHLVTWDNTAIGFTNGMLD